MPAKLRVALHKFSSCDGCQLAFLNLGEALLELGERVELVHFAEAGPLAEDEDVDVAFVEGSISTAADEARIRTIRAHSRVLVATGVCATYGGIQALRNGADVGAWTRAVYGDTAGVDALPHSSPMAAYVKIDFELWGCPINGEQVLAVVKAALLGVAPPTVTDKVCGECKRRGYTCVLVSQGIPCMGPVTRDGCGALCPSLGRDCYGCYGPADTLNTDSLSAWFAQLGLAPRAVMQRYHAINSQAPAFRAAAAKASGDSDG
jgi:coenzyme F420-reducing hydrogenase gamma subunit